MTDYPLTMPVTFMKYRADLSATNRNAVGNLTKVYDPPQTLYVYAWLMGNSTEPRVNGHQERVVWDATIFPAVEAGVSAYDKFNLPGYGEFEVDGMPGNWDNNPEWSPGLVQCNLKKVTG